MDKYIGAPLGNVAYAFLLLLCVAAALGMAWGEWNRANNTQTRRLLLAMAGLTVLRALQLLVATVALTGWLSLYVLSPPLERLVDSASLILLAWLYMPPARRGMVSWGLACAVALVLVLGIGAVFTVLWGRAVAVDATLSYNGYWQATVWSVLQIGLIMVASLAVVRNQGVGRAVVLLAMAFMMAGQIFDLLFAAGGDGLNAPIGVRLGNLLAYPLITVGIYQRIMAGLRAQNRQLQDISQASLDQIKSLLYVFDASQRMVSSSDRQALLENAIQGTARTLAADQCAIALPVEHDPNQMRLAVIYNPTRQGRTEGSVFPLEFQPSITEAMRNKSYVLIEGSDSVQLKTLFSLLGSGQTGPLLVQPLMLEREPLGVLIAGNACSRRPFTANDAKLCQVMADQIVVAIQNLQRNRAAQDKIAELTATRIEALRASQEAKTEAREQSERVSSSQAEADALRQTRDALEIKLLGRRAEADTLIRRIAALEQELARYQFGSPQPTQLVLSEQGIPSVVAQTKLDAMAGALEDLRTSMTTIIGYTELLLSEAMGSVGDAQRKFLIRIKSGAEHVAQTIRDLAKDADSSADATASAGARVITSPHQPVRMDELADGVVAARRKPIDE